MRFFAFALFLAFAAYSLPQQDAEPTTTRMRSAAAPAPLDNFPRPYPFPPCR
jgi:hypothetical protein